MLEEHLPLFALRLTTPRLTLRLAREQEAVRLADVAAAGVHRPGERPFLTPWTEGTPAERARSALRRHWGRLAEWEVGEWSVGLAVFEGDGATPGDGAPLGVMSMWATDFPALREVATGSWLGLEHQGRGIGTEARTALLAFAFTCLDARYAVSQAFPDNPASVAVSRRLGFREDGIARDVRDGEAVTSLRFRLSAGDWAASGRGADVVVEGWEQARSEFGL